MYQPVLDFWFNENNIGKWWKKDDAFDDEIKTKFEPLLIQAKSGGMYDWRESPEGSLAEVILLDQFSRNIYRNTMQAFEADNQALMLAQVAIAKGFDEALPREHRSFFYMPFMHSESLVMHTQVQPLFEKNGDETHLKFELQHKAIIERFGRYPHRNEILGRASTEEELSFLQEEGSAF